MSFTGLLWGYEDDLPCLKMTPPVECDDGSSPFSSTSDDEWDMDDDFGAWRTKREVGDFKKPHVIWEKPGNFRIWDAQIVAMCVRINHCSAIALGTFSLVTRTFS